MTTTTRGEPHACDRSSGTRHEVRRHKPVYVATTGTGGARRLVCMGRDRYVIRQAALRMIAGENWDRPKTMVQDTEIKQLRVDPYGQAVRIARFNQQHTMVEEITALRERCVKWDDVVTPEEGWQ